MIQKDNQRTLADQLFYPEKQNTKTAAFLANAGLTDQLFDEVNRQLGQKGLFVRKGSIVDATMVESTNRPIKKKNLQNFKKNENG